MRASGFGTFSPFGDIPPGTLCLDHAPGDAGDTAILFKVADPENRVNAVRLFDSTSSGGGPRTPALAPPVAPDRRVIALPEHVLEVENALDNIVWESDPAFVRTVVAADREGGLSLKAFRNRKRDDYECLLFDLHSGALADLGAVTVGFRRWAIVRRGPHGERSELFRFEI